jgi:hypothetical protein
MQDEARFHLDCTDDRYGLYYTTDFAAAGLSERYMANEPCEGLPSMQVLWCLEARYTLY